MSRTAREILNEANPNKLADANRVLPMGECLNLVVRTVRGAVVSNVLVLPEAAKASTVLAAYSVAGTLTGQLAPGIAAGTPATGEARPNAGGDIAFAPANAVTLAEVQYLAFEGPIIEDLIVVASDVGTLLGQRAAGVIVSVESLAGAATGVFGVAPRGGTPAAGFAVIQDDPEIIEFAGADAVTSARVRYIAQPGVGSTAVAVGLTLDDESQDF